MYRIKRLDDVSLETKVRDVLKRRDFKEIFFPHNLVNEFPGSTRYGDLVFLHGDVMALTSLSYLKSVDPRFDLSRLFSESEGDFYPCNPRFVEELPKDEPFKFQ